MTAKSVSQVLSEAADLLEKPGAWTQGAFARVSPQGEMTSVHLPEATCFCIRGAIARVSVRDVLSKLQYDVAEELGFPNPCKLADWNDRPIRTQSEVVAKLREAAALAKEQGR